MGEDLQSAANQVVRQANAAMARAMASFYGSSIILVYSNLLIVR
jgi:hypothetical protein